MSHSVDDDTEAFERESNTTAQVLQCSSRSCPNASCGSGPVSGLALCSFHLNCEAKKALERQTRVLRSLRLIREPAERQEALKQEFEALSSQLIYVQESFEAMRDSIQQCSDGVVLCLRQAQDRLARKLNDTTEAMDCEKELTLAGSDRDQRRAMDLVQSMELWLDEANERSADFRRFRGSTGHLVTGVQQLKQIIEQQIAAVMSPPERPSNLLSSTAASRPTQPLYPVISEASWLSSRFEQATAPPPPAQVCRLLTSIDSLPSEPHHVTVCTSTTGFACDLTNQIVRANRNSADQQFPLPEPCIFISFLPECVDHLLVTSLTGPASIRFHCNLDWQVWINGLYCDDSRQQLFIAQANVVTVASLSGEVVRVISARSIGVSIDWISSIAASADRLFILDIGRDTVLCVNKDSGLLVSVVKGDANGSGDFGGMHELTQCGDALLVAAKNGQLHQLNAADPQRRLSSYSGFFQRPPWKMAADNRGLLFASEPDSNAVKVLSIVRSSGVQLLQTITGPAVSASRLPDANKNSVRPLGLAVVQQPNKHLVVADSATMRLVVYELL